jgi:hypothetical protein
MQDKIKRFTELIESHYIIGKLVNPNLTLYINENDYDVYDAWEWNHPLCYSFTLEEKINLIYNFIVKLSINTRDGELVLHILTINTKVMVILKDQYEKYGHLNRLKDNFYVYCSKPPASKMEFEGYWVDHDDYVYNLIDQCLQVLL